jgi:hypothetical protein
VYVDTDTTASELRSVPACAVVRAVAHNRVAVLSLAAHSDSLQHTALRYSVFRFRKKNIDFNHKLLLNLQPFFLFLKHIFAVFLLTF